MEETDQNKRNAILERVTQDNRKESTHEDEKRYKYNIGEEVSGLSKAWRVEFEASAVGPHYGYDVREAEDIALGRRNLLK